MPDLILRMKPLSFTRSFRLLARNQYKIALRRMQLQQGWFVRIVIGVMMVYSAFILLTLGFFFDRFTEEVWPTLDPLTIVNRYLLAMFVSIFFVRFLFQKTPKVKVVPYLHLPIRRGALVAFFQSTSLLSIHNFYPLLFFIPFWLRYVQSSEVVSGHAMWLIAVFLLIASSHYTNLLLRAVLQRKAAIFYGLMTVFMVTAFIDETSGIGVQQRISEYVFSHILSGGLLEIGILFLTFVMMAPASTIQLSRTINNPESREEITRVTTFSIPESWGLTGQLVRLELLLMWRNRRPRHYLLVSLLFSTMYLVFMLGNGKAFNGYTMAALLGLFASGGFVLNYGQLMFGWDSEYYPALVTRNIPFKSLVKAKLIVLQGSCIVLFFTSLPLFIWFRPDLVPLHFAFLFYNAGITSVLVIELASRNSQAVDIGRSGGFFNYEGFSAKHWIWFIPTALPPVLFMLAMRSRPSLGLVSLATLGLISILMTDMWTRYFARGLQGRKHTMIEGFSKSAN
jgi:hypothetical protein